MDPKDAAVIADGAKLINVMPQIEAEIGKLETSVVTVALTEIDRGALTPEKALNYWYQLHSYKRLGRRMRQKVAVAQSVGTIRADQMEI